jgi:hypothetical protein
MAATPFPRCADCRGWGLGLVSARTLRCAACERALLADISAPRTYGPEPALTEAQAAAWRSRHLSQLSSPSAWRTIVGEPRTEVVLALSPPLTVSACTQLAAQNGFVAAPTQRTACTCQPEVVWFGVTLTRMACMCPRETWITYTRL